MRAVTWRRRLLWVWAALSLVWLAGVAYVCLAAWPSLPLDLSANDAATRSALVRAIAAHGLRSAILGLAPPLVLLALGWLGARLFPARR
jgi:hypothetical protein